MGCLYVLLAAVNRHSRSSSLLWCASGIRPAEQAFHGGFFLSRAVVAWRSTERRLFASKWFWAAAAIAFLMASHVVWQYAHLSPRSRFAKRQSHSPKHRAPAAALPQAANYDAHRLRICLDSASRNLFYTGMHKRFSLCGFTYLAFPCGDDCN